MSLFPFEVAVWLFLVGLYGIVTSRNLIHLIICLSVVQSSTYMLLISVGYRIGGTAPIYNEVKSGSLAVDPVIHALILTDLVVGATVTALLLSLAVQIHDRTGSLDPHEIAPLRQR